MKNTSNRNQARQPKIHFKRHLFAHSKAAGVQNPTKASTPLGFHRAFARKTGVPQQHLSHWIEESDLTRAVPAPLFFGREDGWQQRLRGSRKVG